MILNRSVKNVGGLTHQGQDCKTEFKMKAICRKQYAVLHEPHLAKP